MPVKYDVVKMLREDLVTARAAWLGAARTQADGAEPEDSTFLAHHDDAGRQADFHALRHTFISARARRLARGKCDPTIEARRQQRQQRERERVRLGATSGDEIDACGNPRDDEATAANTFAQAALRGTV